MSTFQEAEVDEGTSVTVWMASIASSILGSIPVHQAMKYSSIIPKCLSWILYNMAPLESWTPGTAVRLNEANERTCFLCSDWICRCILHHFGCSAVTSYSVEEQSLKKVSLTQCLVSWLGKAVTVWVQQHVSVAHSSEFKPNPSTTCHQTWYSYHRPDIRFLSTH